ncbi:MAG: GAP family protein [Actinobacteria bacterium]|nr:GAP family protein [Actinomycetota bacterium]
MHDILSLALVVSAIALPDSINPSLILADFYLAAGPHPVRRTAVFAIAVFTVTLLGGVLIMLGLAELVRSLLPTLSSEIKYALITAGGVSLGLGGAAIWFKREALAGHRRRRARNGKAQELKGQGQSAVLMGGGIAGVELLTAFPYFAAIGIIVGSNASTPGKVVLLGIYNLVYVLPLIGISIVCAAMGPRASGFLNRIRDGALNRWPVVVAPLAVVLGFGLTVFGVLHLTGS